MNINEGAFNILVLYNIIISLFKILKILVKVHLIRLGIIHIKFGIKIIIMVDLNQLNWIFKIVVDGSKILNKFIKIFWFNC